MSTGLWGYLTGPFSGLPADRTVPGQLPIGSRLENLELPLRKRNISSFGRPLRGINCLVKLVLLVLTGAAPAERGNFLVGNQSPAKQVAADADRNSRVEQSADTELGVITDER